MISAEELGPRSRDLARRFLQTAVVVDDAAYMARGGADGPRAEVVAPSRHTPPSSQDDRGPVGRGPMHALDAGSITDSFSALGVICGVVGPTESAMETMRQADIVILDWLLQEGDPRYALKLLRGLLTGEADRNSLRLVAIYTGEARLEEIRAAVSAELKEAGLDPVENETRTEVSYRHGRVVLYAKSGVNLAEPLRERSAAEEDLPGRLVEDFASMTEGLLPGIALTSLSAVREGEHKILDRFCSDLDPAFLARMACSPDSEDAERQVVAHVAEELRGLMDNAVADFRSRDHDEIQKILPAFRELYAKATAEHGTGHPVPDAYRARMKFLQDEAAHDGHVLNHASGIDFERFVRSAPDIRRGDLVLMDNGNLRAIWRDGQGTHLGLQFLGGGMLQYVIFKKRAKEQSISRATGRDSLEGLERQFDAFELHSLLYE